MSEIPVTISPGGRAYFTEGVLAYAGPWVHEVPLEDHTPLGELEYAVLLSEVDPGAGRARFQVVRLPINDYSPDNRLRMDQLITDLTVEDF